MKADLLANLGLSPEQLRRKNQIWSALVAAMLLYGIWHVSQYRWAPVISSWSFILKGLGVSIGLAMVSITLGAIIAVPLAILRVYGPRGASHLAVGLIETVRAIPELMVVFWVFFSIPRLTGFVVGGWTAAAIAMTTIAAAYLAEVMRAGLFSVGQGQWEAGRSTGISDTRILFHIILPQALRNMLPALLGQLIMLFKTTSLVYIVGVVEFFKATQIVNNNTFTPHATYTVLAVGYFICCSAISYCIYRLDPNYTVTE